MPFYLPPPARHTASAAPRRLLAAAAAAGPPRRRARSTVASPPSLRPFPWPRLHVGTDICRISRVHAILTADTTTTSASTPRAARFIRRVLSPLEVAALVASASAPPSASSSASSASSPPSTDTDPSPPPPTPPPPPPALAAHASTPQVVAWLLAGGRPVDPPDLSRETAADEDTSSPSPSSSSSSTPSTNDPRLQKAAEFLAGRFAAKEAAIKAHPHLPQKLTFHQIRIVRRHNDTPNSGPPVALVRIDSGPSQDVPCEQEARLSISHDGDYATAVCLGFDGSDSDSPLSQ